MEGTQQVVYISNFPRLSLFLFFTPQTLYVIDILTLWRQEPDLVIPSLQLGFTSFLRSSGLPSLALLLLLPRETWSSFVAKSGLTQLI